MIIVEACTEAGARKRRLETCIVYSRRMAGILEEGDEAGCQSVCGYLGCG
jgi:hypothetical protein